MGTEWVTQSAELHESPVAISHVQQLPPWSLLHGLTRVPIPNPSVTFSAFPTAGGVFYWSGRMGGRRYG